jgi:hypothetical protein
MASSTSGPGAGQVRRLATQEVEGAMIRMLVKALTSPARLLERFERGHRHRSGGINDTCRASVPPNRSWFAKSGGRSPSVWVIAKSGTAACPQGDSITLRASMNNAEARVRSVHFVSRHWSACHNRPYRRLRLRNRQQSQLRSISVV